MVRTTSQKRKCALFLIFAASALLVLKNVNRRLKIPLSRPVDARYLRDVEHDRKTTQPNAKVVFTFVEPMENGKPAPYPLNERTQSMIDTWKHSWSMKGWEPRVLHLADARQHPEFKELMNDLDKIPLGENEYYEKVCFIRYMAMAQAGGGWMSDYDTVPLVSPPSDWSEVGNRFTVYQTHVPALISGSASEYERVLRLMVRIAKEKANDGNIERWSDMLSLLELSVPQDKNFRSEKKVMSADIMLLGGDLPTKICNGIQRSGALGVHFSHKAVHSGNLTLGESADDRPTVIKSWLALYDKKCNSKAA